MVRLNANNQQKVLRDGIYCAIISRSKPTIKGWKLGRHNNDSRLLEHMPATRRKLIEITGIPTRTAFNVIHRLHDAGKIHVIGWERTPGGGPFVEIWQAGEGVDAYCQLKPMTTSQIWARHKAKLRKSGELQDRLAAKRARYHADKAASSKNKATWLSALGVA